MLGLDIYPTSSIYHAWIGYISHEQYIPCLDWISILRVVTTMLRLDIYPTRHHDARRPGWLYILRVACIMPGIDIYSKSRIYPFWNGYLSYAYLISKSSTSIH